MSIEKRGMHRQRGEVCTWCNLSSTDAVISPAACSMSTLISASVSCVSAEGVCADIRRVCDVVWRRMSAKCMCVSALFRHTRFQCSTIRFEQQQQSVIKTNQELRPKDLLYFIQNTIPKRNILVPRSIVKFDLI
jgi:hypothetical protein